VTAALFAVLLALGATVLALLGARHRRLRAERSRRLSALARSVGLRRVEGETDEELRARFDALLRTPPVAFGKHAISAAVRVSLATHGYRASRVDVRADPETGVVTAFVPADVPPEVCAEIERGLVDVVPIFAVVAVQVRS
jgi:hypothetical protein